MKGYETGSLVVFLPCSDIGRTVHFYHEVLGLDVQQVQGDGSSVIFDTGYGYIGFVQYRDGRRLLNGRKGVCISLNCRDRDDVDHRFKALQEKGVTVLQEPRLHPNFPVYSCFFADPDDYTVEYQKIDD